MRIPAALAPHVSEIAIVRPHATPRRLQRAPDGCASLLLRFVDDRAEIAARGPTTRIFSKTLPARHRGAAVLFRPGGASQVFGPILEVLTDAFVPIDTLWGARGTELLARASHQPDRAPSLLVEATLHAMRLNPHLGSSGATLTRLALARVDAALAQDMPLSVHSLADSFRVTSRHLRRVFSAHVGLSPKHYMRIARARHALSRHRASPSRSWAAIAAEAGYHDQAHLTRDIRALYGVSPGALAHSTVSIPSSGRSRDDEPASTR